MRIIHQCQSQHDVSKVVCLLQFEDDAVVVAGWGAIKFRGPQSPALLEGTIKVVNNTDCADKFKSFRQGC